MSLGKNRLRIFCKGLGNVEIIDVEPTPGTSFSSVGYIKSAVLTDVTEQQDVIADTGDLVNVLPTKRMATFLTELLQSSKDEIDLIVNSAGKVHALRYYGPVNDTKTFFQYYCMERVRLEPNLSLEMAVNERLLPLKAHALKQDELSYDVPLYYKFEGYAEMKLASLTLWYDPSLSLNTESAKLLDISGFGLHGTLNSDYATIWNQTTTPKEFLRFDGTNDEVNVGNYRNDDGTSDFLIELWARAMDSDGNLVEIMAKKTLYSNNTAGYAIVRSTGNKIVFKICDGTNSVSVTSSSSVLQNVWKHIAVAVDRNGNATLYINGVADGTPQSVAGVSSGTNAVNLYLGRDGTNFGQCDIGAVRIHTYGAGLLPSDIATIVLNHYNAEKANYGL